MSNTKWDAAARRAWKILSHWKIPTHHRRLRPFAVDLRLVRRFINRLAHPISSTRLRPRYAAERQFSFHETPMFRRQKVEFDCAVERCVVDGDGGACDCEEEDGDGGIDLRAEKFISMFYEEMKMQNQVSYFSYDEFSDSDDKNI